MFWNKTKGQEAPPQEAPPQAEANPVPPAAGQVQQPPLAGPPAVPAASPPSGPSAAAAPARASQPSLNSQLAASLGKVIAVLMFSERYRSVTLADITTTFLPPVVANQFVVAEARPKGQDVTAPVGLVLWAKLSDELDQKFQSDPNIPTALTGAQWTSGNNIWIIETAGPVEVVEAMLKQLIKGPLDKQPFKVRARAPDGSYTVQSFN